MRHEGVILWVIGAVIFAGVIVLGLVQKKEVKAKRQLFGAPLFVVLALQAGVIAFFVVVVMQVVLEGSLSAR